MGLLSLGTPLPWLDSRQYNEHVKDNGIEQLLNIFLAANCRHDDPLYWGDELEYMVCQFNKENRNVVLSVTHDDVLTTLNTDDLALCNKRDVHFHPEYGRFMLEATPAGPYKGAVWDYVEKNMEKRRLLAEEKLKGYKDHDLVVPLSLTVFPRMGCSNFINLPDPWSHKNNASRSLFLPDEIINRHARFPTLTANIRTRRGEKVCMNIPMYQDVYTPETDDSIYPRSWFYPEDLEAQKASKPGFIYMDSMGFGMGCSCLQVTFQAPDIGKARYLYDALANFAPIMLCATASAPVFKGFLADQDVRWNVIAGAVDDRTPVERGTKPLLPRYNDGYGGIAKDEHEKMPEIPKSRYSVVDLFLGGNPFFDRKFNDTDVPINEKVLNKLLENDRISLDYDLARHFAHLYVRDPLVIFQESIDQDNSKSNDHFENIQSTNWQTLRFKPPTQEATPDNKDVPGWRVEFRPMEVQLTDFENAAYTNFIYLLVECFLQFGDELDPYLPMSQIWENMDRAHSRDGILDAKFFWKKSFESNLDGTSELSIDEIFHNEQSGIFPVFINRILKYRGHITKTWQELSDSPDLSMQRTYYYLKLISDRASGKLPTAAKFIRNYILNHPNYKQDSKVTQEISYTLLQLCLRLTHLDNTNGEVSHFLGNEISKYLRNNKL